MIDILPAGLTLWEMAAGLSGIAIGRFLRGFLGFGAALLIVPVLTLIVTPVEAVVIFVLMEIPNVIYLMPSALREFELRRISFMILGMLIGIPAGSYILVSVDSNSIKLAISTVVLLLVVMLASGWKIKGKIGPHIMLLTGIIGGTMHGSVGLGGPPFVTILLSRIRNPLKTRANIVMVLNCLSIFTAISLLSYGTINTELLVASCVAAPIYILCTATGSHYFRGRGNEYFKKVALIILAFISLSIIYSII